MKQKVYRKDHFENIKIFKDIPHQNEYSSYSIDLNRHFGDLCYPEFFKHLKEQKKYDIDYFKKLFEKENQIKGLKKYEESFDIDKFKKSLKNMSIKEIEYNKRLKNPYSDRMSNSKNFLITEYIKKKPKVIKPYYPEIPEVGRYSPSYNFINKHVYEVSFSKTGLNKSNQDEKNINKNEGKKFFNNIIKILPNKNELKTINSLEINNNKNYITTMICTPKKRLLSLNSSQKNSSRKKIKDKLNMKNKEDNNNLKELYNKTNYAIKKIKNNHCLRFENYTSRKSLIKEIPYNTENKIELPNFYTEKYIKGNIDFNKISSNKKMKSYFEEMANKDKNPPLGFYKPKYNSVMNKTRDIYFNKKDLPSSKQKKFKQIIYSYDVPYNYQIAPALNDRTKFNINLNIKIE